MLSRKEITVVFANIEDLLLTNTVCLLVLLNCCKVSPSHNKLRRHSSALSKTDRRNADYTWIGWVIFCFLIYQTWGFTWFVDSHLDDTCYFIDPFYFRNTVLTSRLPSKC